jgi:outer membrane protein OmpA-like peptidoglycan-associated protein
MKPVIQAGVVALTALMVMLQGCPSAYQGAYDTQMRRLEAQERANQAEQEAAHAEAQKYAAIIYFAVGSAAIDQDGQRQLTWFVQKMQPYPQAIIQVQGFADSTGGAAENQALSEQRAANVTAFLNSQGIASSRIITQGFGTQYAAASNATTQGRRNNRRVEVTVR